MARPGRQGEGRVARRVLHRSCTIPSKAETPWWSGGNDSRRPFRAPLPPTVGRGRPGSCHRVPVPAVYLGLVVRCPAPARGAVDGDVPTAVADHDGRQALVARRPGSFAPARLRRVLRSIREWDSSGGRGPHVAPPVDIDTGRRGHERAMRPGSHSDRKSAVPTFADPLGHLPVAPARRRHPASSTGGRPVRCAVRRCQRGERAAGCPPARYGSRRDAGPEGVQRATRPAPARDRCPGRDRHDADSAGVQHRSGCHERQQRPHRLAVVEWGHPPS
jgi:hypothetical protein